MGALARRLRIPYPIVLVSGGLLLSLLPGIPRIALNPEVVFFGILPPLLFAAAFVTSWRDFRYNMISICLLAFGLVGFTVCGVAAVSRWVLPGFDWHLGLVLGAVVAPTDAIAATAIARRLGLPRRIVDVLEGESLVNDASGLLALEFALALLVTGAVPTVAAGLLRLGYLVVGGIGIGLLIGAAVRWFEQHVNDAPIEVVVSLLTPYTAYLAAEAAHASGVLAAVSCGLYLGYHSAEYFASNVRIEAHAVWNTVTFGLNGVVFVLIGLQLPIVLSGIRALSADRLALGAVLFVALVIVLRLAWTYPGAYVSYALRRALLHQPEPLPSARAIFVVGWTGMRGVVALAAAIALPETLAGGAPFPARDVIIFLTFCVIFVTLVLQGLTLPAVIRSLGLARRARENPEERHARRTIVETALGELERARGTDAPEFQAVYDDLALHYQRRLARLEEDGAQPDLTPEYDQRYRDVAQRLRQVERVTAITLRNQNKINDETLRTLLRELDLLDTRSATSESP